MLKPFPPEFRRHVIAIACKGEGLSSGRSRTAQKNELDRQRRTTRDELRLAIITWIERTYHRRRRQRRPGLLTPSEYETLNSAATAA